MVRSTVGTPQQSFDEEGMSPLVDVIDSPKGTSTSLARVVNRIRNSMLAQVRTKEGQKSFMMMGLAAIVLIVGKCFLYAMIVTSNTSARIVSVRKGLFPFYSLLF